MSADTFCAVFKEMVDWIDDETHTASGQDSLVTRARALLAQTEQERLTAMKIRVLLNPAYEFTGGMGIADDAQLVDFEWWNPVMGFDSLQMVVDNARAALARWGHPTPQPQPVSERPWERKGWCDEEGQCWMGDPGGGEFIPSWRLCRPDDAPNMKVSLPFNALPLPEGNDN